MSAQPQRKKKSGLQVSNVSKDHWSVGGHVAKAEGTRLVVTILHGKGLLASDIYTGKSDPICFLSCGPSHTLSSKDNATDDYMATTDEDECANIGIFRTKVCATTLEPIWNEDIIFPLTVGDTFSLSQLRCIIYVRDEDINEVDGDEKSISYDELGMCEISLKDILINGKARKQSIVDVSRQLDLRSSPKMKKKAEGYIKVTCTLIFDETDTKRLYPEVGDDIKTLEVFLMKFQMLLRERNEKENGTQTLWGRAPSPQTGTRRTLVSEVGTCPSEMTGRSNSRAIRNSRSRSPLTPQVANRIRISSASSEGERGNKRDASAIRLKQRSQNDLIEGIENDSEADAEIEEDEDDDDEEEEYDMSEHLLLPMYTEEGEGEMEEDNEPDDSHQFLPRVEYREGEPRVSEIHEPESFYNENALSCEYFEKSSGMGRTSLERARSTMGLTVPTLDNSTILASASAPVLERDLGNGIKSRRVKDYKTVQGNATTAARSLREVEILDPDSRSQKQQSIEYLSKLSPESIIELSQLLQAMEAIRKGDQVSILPVSDQSDSRLPVGKRTVKRGAVDKKFPAIENKENREKQPVEVITRKSITANARPELRDFKKQQQKARKIAREDEFFQMQSASSSSSRSSDIRGMPVAELLLKAPNSSDVIRAILDPEGMTIITKDKDKNKDKNRDIDFTFNALGGDESLPLPSSSFPSLHTVEDSTPRTMETLNPPVIGKMSSPPSTFQPDAASTLQQDTSSSGSNSSSSSGARLQWQAVHHCLSTGDTVAAFSLVLERGELEDLAHIMKLVGPRPHLLSQSVRNRVYDGIATIVSRSNGRGTMQSGIDSNSSSSSSHEEDRLTERCLYWILALLRGGDNAPDSNQGQRQGGQFREGVGIGGTGRMGISRRGSLADSMSGHTKRNLRESLDIVSAEKSKRGLLAALLVKHF